MAESPFPKGALENLAGLTGAGLDDIYAPFQLSTSVTIRWKHILPPSPVIMLLFPPSFLPVKHLPDAEDTIVSKKIKTASF